MGVEIVRSRARVLGPHAVEAGARTLEARFLLLCTESRPAVPDVPGLSEAGFLTSETVWSLERPPRSLIVIGGGPVGAELAQAYARLGVRVKLVERLNRLLPREEPELSALLAARLRAEGVDVRLGVEPARVSVENGGKIVHVQGGRHEGEELSVAVGRAPNVEELGLEEVGVRVSPRGIEVDAGMRTSARSIYAAGDVVGRFWFTHAAAWEASVAVRNMFFPGRQAAGDLVPWCTFTDPELAHVGPTAARPSGGSAPERCARGGST